MSSERLCRQKSTEAPAGSKPDTGKANIIYPTVSLRALQIITNKALDHTKLDFEGLYKIIMWIVIHSLLELEKYRT